MTRGEKAARGPSAWLWAVLVVIGGLLATCITATMVLSAIHDAFGRTVRAHVRGATVSVDAGVSPATPRSE